MSSKEMIYYLAGGGAALIFFISVSYWSVNMFIKQLTERTYERFREHLAKETELAIKLFREGLCEQIVHQENKSDSLAKLYATLIDLMRIGKEFTISIGKGDMQQAERRLRTIRDTCSAFFEIYQKQSLHFSDEFCAVLDDFIAEQKAVIQCVETNWNVTQQAAPENSRRETEIKQGWLQFEDRITHVMDAMRNEFRKHQAAPGNVMMKWLNEVPPPNSISSPTAKS
jgi:hypothetical protein